MFNSKKYSWIWNFICILYTLHRWAFCNCCTSCTIGWVSHVPSPDPPFTLEPHLSSRDRSTALHCTALHCTALHCNANTMTMDASCASPIQFLYSSSPKHCTLHCSTRLPPVLKTLMQNLNFNRASNTYKYHLLMYLFSNELFVLVLDHHWRNWRRSWVLMMSRMFVQECTESSSSRAQQHSVI